MLVTTCVVFDLIQFCVMYKKINNTSDLDAQYDWFA